MSQNAVIRGKVKPARMILRINGEEYIAYGLLDEQKDYVAFEVELLVRNNNKDNKYDASEQK